MACLLGGIVLFFGIVCWRSYKNYLTGKMSQSLLFAINAFAYILLILGQLFTIFIVSILYRIIQYCIEGERYLVLTTVPFIAVLRLFHELLFIIMVKSRDPSSKLPWSNQLSSIELSKLAIKLLVAIQILSKQTVRHLIYLYYL